MKTAPQTSLVLILVLVTASVARAGGWQTFRDCRYLPNVANDGDSFHVQAGDKEYIFRLYFVDTPETDSSIPNRVAEQSKYFRVTIPQTLQIGHEAERFTRQKLMRPFTVRTCLQDARGRSRLPRYFAFVQTDTADLGELLVANGLARVFGAASDPPGMDRAEIEWEKLQRFERTAQEQRVGGWGIGAGRLSMRAAVQPRSSQDSFDAFFHRKAAGSAGKTTSSAPGGRLNVNTASMEALQDIPGIGHVLAGRIIEARPFQSPDDLRHVKGIGERKYEKLRPYFD
ncbi:MAG: helix-hairpin-helix domain-containing protein [Spartobacteria bacterium]